MSGLQKILPANNHNHVGIELEFDLRIPNRLSALKKALLVDPDFMRLDYETITHDNHHWMGNLNGYELTLLSHEDDFEKNLLHALAVLNDPAYSAYVDARCGLHIHLDARNRDADRMVSVLLEHQPFILDCVAPIRRNNPHMYDHRGVWAFRKYKTVEVRYHEATFDFDRVRAFIRFLLTLAKQC